MEARARAKLAWLRFYYWATPIFFLADAVWGVSVRACFLPRADLRYGYYVFCLLCAAVWHRWPAAGPWVGMGESAVNLLLLSLGVMLPIASLPDAVLAGGEVVMPLGPSQLVNVMLSGTVLILAFHRHQWRATGRLAGARMK